MIFHRGNLDLRLGDAWSGMEGRMSQLRGALFEGPETGPDSGGGRGGWLDSLTNL